MPHAKNQAAVVLGRKGGKKGGPARAAILSAEQRSQSARKAVLARWAKAGKVTTKKGVTAKPAIAPLDTSDNALRVLLRRLKTTVDRTEIRHLSDQIERVVFHKQFKNG